MAASGSTAETDYQDPTGGIPPKPSLYSMGPGLQAVADVEVVVWDALSFRAIGRSWWIDAITPVHGLERMEVASLGAWASLPARQFVGAEGSLQRRLPAQPADVIQSGWTARVMWGVRLGNDTEATSCASLPCRGPR